MPSHIVVPAPVTIVIVIGVIISVGIVIIAHKGSEDDDAAVVMASVEPIVGMPGVVGKVTMRTRVIRMAAI
jgi:hypothetical protein